MKKIILSVILILVCLSLSLRASFAQEELSVKETTKSIEYELPYPGILPDNPLYFLKAIRDRIVDFLISDPLKKADFYLLSADKRLNTGVYLFNKGKDKYALAESTISKGENYFEKAIAKAEEAKRQGMDISDIARRLHKAALKHSEVILKLQENKNIKTKDSFKTLLLRVEEYEKQARALAPK